MRSAGRDQQSPWTPSRLSCACLLAVALCACVSVSIPVAAEELPVPEGEWHEPAAPSVKLSYLMKPWRDVLSDVAEATDSTLVMQQVPNGRLTRRDTKRYCRAEAVRILNRELEPTGYRILEKGQYLVIVSSKDTRTRYRGPQLAVSPSTQTKPPELAAPAPPTWKHETHTITGKPAYKADKVASQEPPHPIEQADSVPPSIETVAGTDVEIAKTRIRARHRSAAEIAKAIYEPVKPNARLTPAEPGWPPAFEVFPKPADSAVSRDYKIGIDVPNNELVVESTGDRIRQVELLIERLDLPTTENGSRKFVPHTGDVKRLAAQLQPVLNTLAAAHQQQEPAEAPQDEFPPLPSDAQPQAPEAAPVGDPLQLNLQGPVSVQDVPGVGLVVSGNREDVDAVLQVINSLKAAGTGVVPDMHLLNLQHVSSDVLAELLTSLYDNLTQMRGAPVGAVQQLVRVLAVSKPNAILILAPAREIQSVVELAEQLDTPVDGETEFEVFRLRHAVASQVVTNLTEFYSERVGLGTRIRIFGDVRTNSVIVHARPRDLDEVAKLIEKLDTGKSSAVNQIQIFTLQNATAATLEQVLNSAIQSVINPPVTPGTTGAQQGGLGVGGGGGAGQGAEQMRDARSAVLEFLTTDGEAQRLVRSGVLADIRVTADTARNNIIVSAPAESMDLMAALIKQLDTPTPLVAEIKVFNLRNADANATATLLQELFETQADSDQPGIQLAGAEGAGAGLIPLRFAVDVRTNSVTAIGSAEALQIVEAIVLRLDESEVRQRQNTVIKLKNIQAAAVAVAINEFRTAQRELAQIDEDLVSNIEMLEQEIVVVAEEISNSLLISATPRYYDELLRIVTELDQKPPEVVIQALLVEVELQNDDEFGVELGFQDPVLFDRSNATTNLPGFNFNNNPLGNNPVSPAQVGEQALSNFSLGRTNPALGFGGLVLAASSESVSVLIRALSAKRNVQVLSRPTIRTLDNQLAQIQVGQQVPIVTGVVTSGTLSTPTIEQQQIGIILAVTPRISPDGTIVIETIATNSALAPEGVPIFTNADDGTVVESPIINVTTAQATISVPNGQTVVLGGMITKSDASFERKVPWLGDIPVLGYAFRYDSVSTRRTELLIFLTPRVIRHEADSELIKRVEAERLHFVERDAEDMHGPLYSAPPEEALDQLFPPGIMPGETDPNCPPTLFDEGGVPTTIMSPGDYTIIPERDPAASGSEKPLPTPPAPGIPPAPGASGQQGPSFEQDPAEYGESR